MLRSHNISTFLPLDQFQKNDDIVLNSNSHLFLSEMIVTVFEHKNHENETFSIFPLGVKNTSEFDHENLGCSNYKFWRS